MSELKIIPDGGFEAGNRNFRMGFLNAFWGRSGVDNESHARRVAIRENVLSSVPDLYHYTSLAGLHGIINEAGFWASDNRFMNDSEEMKHGAKLAARVLQHRKERCSDPQLANVLGAVIDDILSPPRTGNLVACFSKARDSLEQWRGYGTSGAICIRLAGDQPGARPVFHGPHQLPYNVFYDTRPKMVMLLSIIRRFEREYDADREVMSNCWPHGHDRRYIEYLTVMVSSRIVCFKNQSFKQESEVRLVIPFSPLNDYEGGLRFRVSPLGLIPYVCTGSHKGLSGLLPISEVIVGPSPRQELIAESVGTFLDHKGYPPNLVCMSQVPYRSY